MIKQIKVCQVLHGIVGGGSEQVVLNYCSRMHDIHFDLLYQYEPNQQILKRLEEAGFNCIQIPDKIHHPVKHLWTMYRLLKKGEYDVVHSHQDWFLNAYVMFLAWLAGVPKRIAHHHQAYHLANPLLMLFCAILRIPNKLFATHWFACGNAAAINGWGGQAVETDEVCVLPNAVDPERFMFNADARKQIREQYGIAVDAFVVGHIGRFFPQKNHEFLIDVFAGLCKVQPNSKLLLLGEGPLQNEIKDKVTSLDLADKVIFAGLQKDPAPFYSAMDVFCFPSLWEGLPLTLVEAQYSGLVCLICDAVSRETFITDNVITLPITSINPWVDELTKKIKVISSRHVNVNDSHFDIRTCYTKLEMLYKSPNGEN